jgi:hypothetical protein
LCEEMYTRICEESGPADPVLQSVVSDMALMLAEHGNDVDRAEHWALRAADNLRSYVRDSDPSRYWKAGCHLATSPMAMIIYKTASEESKAALYQEAEGLLYDIISKSEEHFGADAFEVGAALTSILILRRTYCPAKPLTSTIELAMRAYGIYSNMLVTQEIRYVLEQYRAFTFTAEAIVNYCDSEEMELLKAAEFLIKEARKFQQMIVGSRGGLDLILDETTDRLKQLMRTRA